MPTRPRRARGFVFVTAINLLAFGGCVAPPKRPASLAPGNYDYAKQQTAWLAKKLMREHKVVGLSVAMVDDQQIISSEGFGLARQSNKVAATAETVYQVGSISKLFTATAVMQLAEAGRIDIDKPLQTYLPQFRIKTRFADAGPITPRMLMTHHSGLPSDRLKGMFWPGNEMPTESFTQVVLFLNDEYAANPPNVVWSYCNLGFSLLGHLVQKVSGEEFITHMHDSVFQPLGMTRSSYAVTAAIEPLLSKAYLDGKEVDPLRIRDLPAGSLVSNVNDLSRFMMMVFADGRSGDHQIIKSQTLAEMLRPQNADVPLDVDLRIGLAWFLTTPELDYAGPTAGHGGSTIVHNSALVCLPKQKLGVVVLTNSNGGSEVASKLANEALKLMVETKTGLKPPDKPKASKLTVAKRSAKDLKAYEGHYSTMAGIVPFKVEGGRLKATLMGVPIRLLPLDDGQFAPRMYLLGLIPLPAGDIEDVRVAIKDMSGRRVVVLYRNDKGALAGEKIEPTPIPPRWQRLGGDYELANPGKDLRLIPSIHVRHEVGFVLVTCELAAGSLSTFAVEPLSDTEGIIMGLGRGTGETVFLDKRDGRDVIRYAGYEFKKKGK